MPGTVLKPIVNSAGVATHVWVNPEQETAARNRVGGIAPVRVAQPMAADYDDFEEVSPYWSSMSMPERLERVSGILDYYAQKHGVSKPYHLEFTNATKTLGSWHESKRLFKISKKMIEHGGEEDVRNTIVHEVAHAIAGYQAGHGPIWKAKARELGYDFDRIDSYMPTPTNNKKQAVYRGRVLNVELGQKVIAWTGDVVTIEKFNTATVIGRRDSDGMTFRMRIEGIERARENYVTAFGDVDSSDADN